MSAETPGVRFQANFKTPTGSLMNYYDYTGEEEVIIKGLTICANVTPYITAVETLYNAQGTLKTVLSATPVEQPRTQSEPSTGAKTCKHGEMKFVSKVGEKGPWKAWMCPSPKGTENQCSPQFIR